jgi:hypothetical protein
MPGGNAEPGAGAGRHGVGTGHEWVRPKINIEQRPLGAFRQDGFAGDNGLVDEVLAVDELKAFQEFNGLEEFFSAAGRS